ncbi:MAG: hypothetical protein AB8B81_11210 [Halioglobus sp.]
MTIIAGVGCVDVGRIFTCRCTSIMATHARSGHATVVKTNVAPYTCGVTIVTSIGTGNMRRVFTGCHRTIVAAGASAHYCEMVHLPKG